MLDIQQKRKFRSFIYNRFVIALLFVLLVFVMHSTWQVYEKREESLTMKNESLSRLNALSQREKELESRINKLATVSGVEEEIRSKFSVAKDDENVVIIIREEATTSPKIEVKKGLWAKFKSLFD